MLQLCRSQLYSIQLVSWEKNTHQQELQRSEMAMDLPFLDPGCTFSLPLMVFFVIFLFPGIL